jgi:hypothetical protein
MVEVPRIKNDNGQTIDTLIGKDSPVCEVFEEPKERGIPRASRLRTKFRRE